MPWLCNRFVDSKTPGELRRKVAELEAKGWRLIDVNENGLCAYLERKPMQAGVCNE